jgi:hypothetical protein
MRFASLRSSQRETRGLLHQILERVSGERPGSPASAIGVPAANKAGPEAAGLEAAPESGVQDKGGGIAALRQDVKQMMGMLSEWAQNNEGLPAMRGARKSGASMHPASPGVLTVFLLKQSARMKSKTPPTSHNTLFTRRQLRASKNPSLLLHRRQGLAT